MQIPQSAAIIIGAVIIAAAIVWTDRLQTVADGKHLWLVDMWLGGVAACVSHDDSPTRKIKCWNERGREW